MPSPTNAEGNSTESPNIHSVDVRIDTRPTGLGFVPLGVSLAELKQRAGNADRVEYHNAHEWIERFWFAQDGGLPVVRVEPHSAAAEGGLETCDVIVAVNGRDIRHKTSAKVCRKLMKLSEQQQNRLLLSVVRCSQLPYNPETVRLLAGQKNKRCKCYPISVSLKRDPAAEIWAEGSEGFGFTPLKFSFAERSVPKVVYKQAKKRCPFAAGVGGLPIKNVAVDGPAARCGLQAWDVITEVNSRPVTTLKAEEIIQIMKETGAGQVGLVLEMRADVCRRSTSVCSALPCQRASLQHLRYNASSRVCTDGLPEGTTRTGFGRV